MQGCNTSLYLPSEQLMLSLSGFMMLHPRLPPSMTSSSYAYFGKCVSASSKSASYFNYMQLWGGSNDDWCIEMIWKNVFIARWNWTPNFYSKFQDHIHCTTEACWERSYVETHKVCGWSWWLRLILSNSSSVTNPIFTPRICLHWLFIEWILDHIVYDTFSHCHMAPSIMW